MMRRQRKGFESSLARSHFAFGVKFPGLREARRPTWQDCGDRLLHGVMHPGVRA